jgi:hypothetical protein
MNTEITNIENAVKKELYKSKVNAKFSHYVSGNLYYTVELEDGIYQFPISTIDIGTLSEINETDMVINNCDGSGLIDFDKKIYDKKASEGNGEEIVSELIEVEFTRLSSDLGTTLFNSEVKGSDLNRWIAKAIKSNDFIKVQ